MYKKSAGSKATIGTLAIALVLTIAIGGTLAFLTDETEKRVNNFTFASADGLDATLTEPLWDGVIDYVYDDNGDIVDLIYDYIDHDKNPATPSVPVFGYTDGDKSKPITDSTLISGYGQKPVKDSTDASYKPVYGTELSKDMIPGQSAPKNPLITNTGTISDSWVAAKVTFVYAAGHAKAGQPLDVLDMAKITDAITINWNVGAGDTNWDRTNGSATSVSQVFYYRSILNKKAADAAPGVYGDSTKPIFTTVTVNSTATNTQISALNDMGGFAIYVEGFAAQSDVGADYSEFKTWGATNVIFTNTPTPSSPAVVAEPGIIAAPEI